jgi:DNA-binding GntR family transcriptional regulator
MLSDAISRPGESERRDMKTIKTIKHASLSERTALELKNLILSGQIKPGDRLYYQELVKLLSVSQTPIRDAFAKLESEGLVFSIPRRGTFVRSYSARDIREIFQIREMLEALAVRLVCERSRECDFDHLRIANERFRKAIARKDARRCSIEDYSFHATLTEMSDNGKLVELMERSNFHLLSIAQSSQNFFEIAGNYIVMHERILYEVESGAALAAESLIREHIRYGEEQVLLFMNAVNDRPGASTIEEKESVKEPVADTSM